ncbi:MAG: DJ-1/PfpI family protein [Muribaculaceae bacterium]|nr:DJ-1/PfpI family protein [Muribaculaceae bacterium]
MKESFVFLAEGFEEMEAICVIDILRRAGIKVRTVSITSSLQVTGAHGISVKADVLFDNTLFSDPEWLILPGGLPGATNLHDFAPLQGLLERQAVSEEGRLAAICASPAEVLGRLGLLKGKKATCYPGFEEKLQEAEYVDRPVVVDGKFVTGNGPSSAMSWALTIVEETKGTDAAMEVANGMLLYPVDPRTLSNYFG